MKVAIVGATGETGRSVVNGLLESTTTFVCIATLLIILVHVDMTLGNNSADTPLFIEQARSPRSEGERH